MAEGVIETGHIFFLFRPRVEVSKYRGLESVQRFFLLLRPFSFGASGEVKPEETQAEIKSETAVKPEHEPETKKEEQPHLKYEQEVKVEPGHETGEFQESSTSWSSKIGDSANFARLLILGRKKLPEINKHGRFWGFVDAVGDIDEIEVKLRDSKYSTKTRGERTLSAVKVVGEGVYSIILKGRSTHLAYCLEFPTHIGPVQRDFNIAKEGSYVISVKNPKTPSPPAGPQFRGVGGKATYPEELQELFHGRQFIPTDPVDFLNHQSTEILLIGAREDVVSDLGKAGEELESLAEEEVDAFEELQDEKVFKDLHMAKERRLSIEFPNTVVRIVTHDDQLHHFQGDNNVDLRGIGTLSTGGLSSSSRNQQSNPKSPSWTRYVEGATDDREKQRRTEQIGLVRESQGSDLIVFNLFCLEALAIAEMLEIPCIAVSTFLATDFPMPSTFWEDMEELLSESKLKRLDDVNEDIEHWLWRAFLSDYGEFRVEVLNLDSLPSFGTKVVPKLLYAFDPWLLSLVASTPIASVVSANERIKCTGEWIDNTSHYQHKFDQEGISRFLKECGDSGAIVIGFGSMETTHPIWRNAKHVRNIIDAVEAALEDFECYALWITAPYFSSAKPSDTAVEQEAVGQQSGSNSANSVLASVLSSYPSKRIHQVQGPVPHNWIFQLSDNYCADKPVDESPLKWYRQDYSEKPFITSDALYAETCRKRFIIGSINHGGIGTIQACLRNGLPQVVYPHMFDQSIWGTRLESAKVGKVMDSEDLAEDSPIERLHLSLRAAISSLSEVNNDDNSVIKHNCSIARNRLLAENEGLNRATLIIKELI
ncbi:hypothetical protein HDU76_013309 [Blyttiomyces sp. JEL0837]|nr:hypothetical protein HDU76_013309 [Blyttiomyces sp. JEL0837]